MKIKLVSVFFAFILIFFLGLYCPKYIFAARSLLISSNKGSLYGDEEMIISASSSGFINGETIYIKGAFYQDGCGSNCNYFGYTKSGDLWIKNGDSIVNQKQIKIGEWDENIVVKSDFLDGGYKGEGSYKFKVGFYYTTSGGTLTLVWSSNILDINLNEPDPTSTPAPTNSPTITSSSTPTKAPTPTPTIKQSVISVTPLVTKAGSASATPTDSLDVYVLGAEDKIISPSPKQDKNSKTPSLLDWGKLFMLMGVVIICSACGILIYKKYKQEREEDI